MASDMDWTGDLGNVVLAQRPDVMDAVQRMRQKAKDFGYLRSNGQIIVSSGPYIEIESVDSAFVVVLAYDPLAVFAPPRPGFVVGGAITFGYGVRIGTFFRPWGWGTTHFAWNTHVVVVNNRPWNRNWANRVVYSHPYPGVRHYAAPARVEHHELVARSQHEREAPRIGHSREEEHHH
jgi:Protein of unknown function (DUF3300)